MTVSELPLPFTRSAPSLARAFLVERLAALPDDVRDDALLLTSELVTNTVRHGRPPVTLVLQLEPQLLRVRIRDLGPAVPSVVRNRPRTVEPGGRGLLIVDTLATAWGIDEDARPPGKDIWFELAL